MASANYKGIGSEKDIADAKAEIIKYTEKIRKHLKSVQNPNTNKAFIGQYATQLQEFIKNVILSVDGVLKELDTFDEKLEAARIRYQQKDEAVAGSIKSAIGS